MDNAQLSNCCVSLVYNAISKPSPSWGLDFLDKKKMFKLFVIGIFLNNSQGSKVSLPVHNPFHNQKASQANAYSSDTNPSCFLNLE